MRSTEVLAAIEDELPPEATPMIERLFRRIGFEDAALDSAVSHRREDGTHRLVVTGTVRGVEAAPRGKEIESAYAGPITCDVHLEGGEAPQRRTTDVQDGRFRFEIQTAARPTRVTVDPQLVLIDRDLSDNEAPVIEARP